MKIHQIRNATIIVTYNDKRFLIDPWLMPKGFMPGFEGAMNGAIFETFVVSKIIKSYTHNSKEPNIYYYRDKEKKEIDVIIEKNGKLYPIEIKKSANPDKSAIKNFSVIPDDKLGDGAVVCLAKEDYPITPNINAIPVSYV